MLKKVILSVAAMLFATSFCLAQTAPAQDKTHRTYDQKFRECKRLGAKQQLTGDASRAFIAKCMKG